MEEKIRAKSAVSHQVSAKLFSIARSDAAQNRPKDAGITIQIRLRNAVSARLVTRKNTEFWLSATD